MFNKLLCRWFGHTYVSSGFIYSKLDKSMRMRYKCTRCGKTKLL